MSSDYFIKRYYMKAQLVDSSVGTNKDGVIVYGLTFLARFKNFTGSSLKSVEVTCDEEAHSFFSDYVGSYFDIDLLLDPPKWSVPFNPSYDFKKVKPLESAVL